LPNSGYKTASICRAESASPCRQHPTAGLRLPDIGLRAGQQTLAVDDRARSRNTWSLEQE